MRGTADPERGVSTPEQDGSSESIHPATRSTSTAVIVALAFCWLFCLTVARSFLWLGWMCFALALLIVSVMLLAER